MCDAMCHKSASSVYVAWRVQPFWLADAPCLHGRPHTMLYGYAVALHPAKPHHLHSLQIWSSLCSRLSVMRWSATLWHLCHFAFVMQIVTVVARLLWHLVLCKGHALIHSDTSGPFEDAQMKVCLSSPGASTLTHVLRTPTRLSSLVSASNSCLAEMCQQTPSMPSVCGHVLQGT